MTEALTGVLLAAGRGTRFGGDKLRREVAPGRPLALVAAESLRPHVDRLLAVVAADGDTAAMFRDAGIETIIVADARAGMGHSLAGGVAASRDSGGWLIALGDMPCVASATVAAIAAALREGATVAVPRYDGRIGHPVGFAAACGAQLMALSGDRGARSVIEQAGNTVRYVDVDDPGIGRDVDMPADLAAILSARS